MSGELQSLIDQAKASTFSHVVVFMSAEGIHWRPQTESACALMADVLKDYGAKAMPTSEFIAGLESAAVEAPHAK